jgi:hypothetical protein
MKTMRIFGCISLGLGFVWIVFCAAFTRPLARGAVLKRYDLLPKQDTFTREQTMAEIRAVGTYMVDAYPSVVPPALVMLGGGILLDRARRNKTKRDCDG